MRALAQNKPTTFTLDHDINCHSCKSYKSSQFWKFPIFAQVQNEFSYMYSNSKSASFKFVVHACYMYTLLHTCSWVRGQRSFIGVQSAELLSGGCCRESPAPCPPAAQSFDFTAVLSDDYQTTSVCRSLNNTTHNVITNPATCIHVHVCTQKCHKQIQQ